MHQWCYLKRNKGHNLLSSFPLDRPSTAATDSYNNYNIKQDKSHHFVDHV